MSDRPPNPCKSCAFYFERKLAGLTVTFPYCKCRERNEKEGTGWATTNRKGPRCPHYVEGQQTTLEV